MLFCLGSQVGFVCIWREKMVALNKHWISLNGDIPLNWWYRSSHRHNCRCAKSGGGQPVRNKTVKSGRQRKWNTAWYHLCVESKIKKKNETNREQIGDCQRQVRGCGSSGWNGRMSEKKESKKNVDSISLSDAHSVQVFENGLAGFSHFAWYSETRHQTGSLGFSLLRSGYSWVMLHLL